MWGLEGCRGATQGTRATPREEGQRDNSGGRAWLRPGVINPGAPGGQGADERGQL